MTPPAILPWTALVLTAALAALVVHAWRRPDARHAPTEAALAAAVGLGFQVVHVVEHLVQVAAWVLDPHAPPALTPWATVARDGFAGVDGRTGTGNELLHLLGNVVFLLGIAGLALIVRARRPDALGAPLRRATWWQGAHVVEHVALTATWLAVGRAVGVTTGLGLLAPGPGLTASRVVAHATINAVATYHALRAVHVGAQARRAGALSSSGPRGSR